MNKFGEHQLTTSFVSTKKCCDKAKAAPTSRLGWNMDGKEGEDDPNNSLKILLDWLTTPPNHQKFRGKDNAGTSKAQHSQRIADLMNGAGVKVKRDAKQVLSKMQHMEQNFRRAHDFANTETGAGLMAEDPSSFADELEAMCPHCHGMLADRANSKPKAATDDVLASDDEASVDSDVQMAMAQEEEQEEEEDEDIPTQLANDFAAVATQATQGGNTSDAPSSKRKSIAAKKGKGQMKFMDEDTSMAFKATATAKTELLQAKKRKMDSEWREKEHNTRCGSSTN